MKRLLQTCFLVAAGPLTLMADTDRGVDLYRQGKYAEAQSELSKTVQSTPNDARALRYLGLALVEQHKASEARDHLNKANELDPGGESKLALARMYIEQKDLDKAEEMLKDADGADRDYVRGLLQFQRGQNKEAAASLESYLQDHAEQPYAHYYAGLAYNALKRPDKMLTHFELFVKLKPDAPESQKGSGGLEHGPLDAHPRGAGFSLRRASAPAREGRPLLAWRKVRFAGYAAGGLLALIAVLLALRTRRLPSGSPWSGPS